ncbi:MAG: PKD domain-containing protein, partial [Bacteroidota bacterium]
AYEIQAEGELRTSANPNDLEYGFCYSTSGEPIYGRDNHVERDNFIGLEDKTSFSNRITGLRSRTQYTVRTYARDSDDNVFYGSSIIVRTGNPEPVVANFSFQPQVPTVGQEVVFQNQSTGSTSYQWSFGDGGSSTQVNPKHTFQRAGTFTIQLTVRNPEGNTDTERKTIQVRSATSNFNPEVYNGASYSSLFQDNFSNNQNEWFEGENSSYKFELRNGAYYCESKNNQVWFIFRDVELNLSLNYDIEMEFRLLSGGENFGHGLRWGYEDVNNNFFFSLIPGQQFSTGTQSRGSYSFWQSWTSNSAVRDRAWNKLTVRKYDRNYYFFVNGRLVSSRSYIAPESNQIAFAVPAFASMEVDNVKVRYIND